VHAGGGVSILGTGVDLVEVDRIREAVARPGFAQRVFTEAEREYCEAHGDPAPHYAARFAAKEAVAKAFGTGIGGQIGFQDIEVGRRATGQPFVRLTGPGAQLAGRLGVGAVHLSLTHTSVQAMALVVVEGA